MSYLPPNPAILPDGQEVKVHGSEAFPFAVYCGIIPTFIPAYPLHYHEEMELIYCETGSGSITIDRATVTLHTGDVAVILPGQIHAIAAAGAGTFRYYNILFRFSLLEPPDSETYRRFLAPLADGRMEVLLAGALAFGALFGAVMYGAYDHIQGEPRLMVILGCQVKPWGPSILLQDRLDKALDYLEEHPDVQVVVSGGQGPDEPTTEAQAMYDYLTEHGVEPERIWQEDQSHNTWQNVRYTLALLEEKGADTSAGVVLVSSGFHLTRARMLWERASGGAGELSTLAAPCTHVPSRLKMYIREPFALVKSFLFDR